MLETNELQDLCTANGLLGAFVWMLLKTGFGLIQQQNCYVLMFQEAFHHLFSESNLIVDVKPLFNDILSCLLFVQLLNNPPALFLYLLVYFVNIPLRLHLFRTLRR